MPKAPPSYDDLTSPQDSGATAAAAPEASFVPGTAERCIPSRYVEGLRHALDPAAHQAHAMRSFREALHMVRFHAAQRLLEQEERVLRALEGLGATRHRPAAAASASAGTGLSTSFSGAPGSAEGTSTALNETAPPDSSNNTSGHYHRGSATTTTTTTTTTLADVRAERRDAEAAVERWAGVVDLVDRLLTELDEHAGLFTEECMADVVDATDEIKSAPWGHPALDPWAAIPSFTPKLLARAQEAPPLTLSRSSFKVDLRRVWTAPEAMQQEARRQQQLILQALQNQQPELSIAPSPVLPSSAGSPLKPTASFTTTAASKSATATAKNAANNNSSSPTSSPAGMVATPPAEASASPASLALPPALSFSKPHNNKEGLLKHVVPPLKILCMTADDVPPPDTPSPDGGPATGAAGVRPSWDLVYVGAENGAVLGFNVPRLARAPSNEDHEDASGAGGNARNGTPADKNRGKGANAASGGAAGSPARRTKAAATAAKGGASRRNGGGVAAELPNHGPYKDVPGVKTYTSHSYAVHCLAAFTHKETRMIASASMDKTVRVSNAATKELVFVFAENRAAVTSVVYHRRMQRLVAAAADGSLSLWEPRFGESSTILEAGSIGPLETVTVTQNFPPLPPAALAAATGSATTVTDAGFTTSRILVGTRSGGLFALEPLQPSSGLHQASAASFAMCFVGPSAAAPAIVGLPEDLICRDGHSAKITCIAAPAHPYIFSGDASGVVNLFHGGTVRRLRRYHGHVDAIRAISVTSDGFLLTASDDATIVAWSWRDGAQLHRFATHYHRVTGMLLGALPKERVNVAALIASTNNALRGAHGAASADRWPGTNTLALRYLPGVAECTIIAAAYDGTISVSAALYDVS